MVITTLASIIVARQLGPAAFGQVAFVLAALSLLSIPSNNAMSPLLIREASIYEQAQNWPLFKGLLTWSRKLTFFTVLTTMIIVGVSVAITRDGNSSAGLFVIATPLLIFWALTGRVTNVLLGLKRTVLAQCFDWLITPATYLLCIAVLWYIELLSPESVLSSTLFALMLATAVGYLVLQRQLPNEIRPAQSEFSEQSWYASWRYFILIQLVSIASIRLPILIMGFLSSDAEIGLYRVAENISSLVAVSLLIVNTVLGPRVSRLHAAGQLSELGRIARSAARMALAFTFPAALIIGFFGEWIVEVVFGQEYSPASTPLILLLISQVFNVACGSVGLILNMTGLEKGALRFWLIGLAVDIILCMLLIPLYGSTGAALSVAVSTIVWNTLLLLFIRRKLAINVAAV